MGSASLYATVTPNGLFCNNAVLQQGMRVPVWGTGSEGEHVKVTFGDQKIKAVTTNGEWMAWLAPMKASIIPQTMTITGSSDSNSVTLTNILVGEVWICSGQSNMKRKLGLRDGMPPIVNWTQEVAAANYPAIRQFDLQNPASSTPFSHVTGHWQVCSPATATNFSAVGYFFARDLNREQKVPIGLIYSAWDGTRVEAWMRQEILATNPELAPQVGALASYLKLRADHQEQFNKIARDIPNLKKEGKPVPPLPELLPDPSDNPNNFSVLFNGLIHPLIPYAIRGVIWYQGESNAPNWKQYRSLFSAMIADWRQLWGEGNFPFLYVQIAPFKEMPPEIREAQFLTLQSSTNTAMAVTIDCGDADNIHPALKQPVGHRLALAARALAYGEPVEYSGPLFHSAKTEGSKVILSFTHAGKGLMVGVPLPGRSTQLTGFTIAGADKVFVPAQAEIQGDTVVVTSTNIPTPVAVRYGWANVAEGNLFNQDGFPASPFRTDPQ
jgi:sialate O-acetylesterase